MRKVLSVMLLVLVVIGIILSNKSIMKAEGESMTYHSLNFTDGKSSIRDVIYNNDGTITVVVKTENRCNVYTLNDGEKLFGVDINK